MKQPALLFCAISLISASVIGVNLTAADLSEKGWDNKKGGSSALEEDVTESTTIISDPKSHPFIHTDDPALTLNSIQQSPSDTTLPADSSQAEPMPLWKVPVDQVSWHLFSDSDEGYNSSAEWIDQSSREVLLTPRIGRDYPYCGFGFMFPEYKSDFTNYDGFIVYGFFEHGREFRVDIAMSSITDYNYHSKTIAGRDETVYTFRFTDLYRSWGLPMVFDPSSLISIGISYNEITASATARIDSVHFFKLPEETSVKSSLNKIANHTFSWKRHGHNFIWMENKSVNLVLCDAKGRVFWRGVAKPNERLVLPRYRGLQFLMTSNKKLIDQWTIY
ncbi:hypothetical protein QA601_15715 [Chitinispirillales bacterium ANBcel5]|uniref:hypothetical protein n=1 Tax=Cellulosispirillum alkaliphilum TaxID=3039283 RepID=UPI002A5419F1|nr:hypothetical protein [Chitinispirillales bacterium ANBcel5]